jgi:hypothetical protein
LAELTIRERCEKRLDGLKSMRQPWEADWRAISTYAAPSRSKHLSNAKNPRRTSNRNLQDGHSIRSFRTLMGGMTSGLSSPSRPWFRLTLHDEDALDDQDAKEWLEAVERQIYALFARTNFYDAAKSGYHELGLFGTEACVMVEHWKAGAVCHPLTAGEFWIDESDIAMSDTLYRQTSFSVLQLVEQFAARPGSRDLDWSNIDQRIHTAWDRSDYNLRIPVMHAIEPNPEWMPGYADFRGKLWRSIWWDAGCNDKKKVLRQSGYEEQPFWAPRWSTTSSDIWGMGPGHDALADMRVLQAQAIRRGQAEDRAVDPEIGVPASIHGKATGRPGNRVPINNEDLAKAGPLFPVDYQAIAVLRESVNETRQKIDESAYADLFMAITNMQGIQPRNIEEIAARNEEKLTQLGPVIERVNVEKLQPAIERAFGILTRANQLPPVPPSLHGTPLKVQFISILTQMQRIVGLGQIERPVGFVGNLAGANPEVLDNIDFDKVVREYGDRAGMPPSLMRSVKEVQKIRDGRAQQQRAAQTAAMMPAVKDGADAANLLSQTDTGDGRSALQSMLGQ